jgi:hypothetical protein
MVEAKTNQPSKLEEPATMYFNPAKNLLEGLPDTKQRSSMHVSLTENEACNTKVYDL